MRKYFLIILAGLFIILGVKEVYAAQNVVVVIDPGHGGYDDDSSAFGAIYKDELYEKDVNLTTALALRDELVKYNNVEVYLTRTDDSRLSLEERVDYAVSVGADVMISCHYNASETHIFYGSEIFTSAFGNCYMTGNSLAQCIMERWEEDGLNSKGIKTRIGKKGNDYYGVIRLGKSMGLPVIIIEHGYLDNHIDYERLGTEADWERMGRLDATGIADYFGLSKDSVLDEVIPTVHVGEPEGRVEPDTSDPVDVTFEILESDFDNNVLTYEIGANEPDGKLMYYGVALGDPEKTQASDYADLILWDEGSSKMRGTIDIPTGYKGMITARVYNTYELYTDSETHEIDFKTTLEERAKKLQEEAEAARQRAKEKEEEAKRRELEKEIERQKEEERNALGDFFFFVGNGGEPEKSREAKDKKELYTEILIAIILFVVLICLIIVRHRKKITKFLKNYDANDWDRY